MWDVECGAQQDSFVIHGLRLRFRLDDWTCPQSFSVPSLSACPHSHRLQHYHWACLGEIVLQERWWHVFTRPPPEDVDICGFRSKLTKMLESYKLCDILSSIYCLSRISPFRGVYIMNIFNHDFDTVDVVTQGRFEMKQ